ncbi:MAG TPA: TolC family protein, partial [Thermoanaerobaculia bacterium]|nr:TolC family protein [Thermoanaerobaculia bacterium]
MRIAKLLVPLLFAVCAAWPALAARARAGDEDVIREARAKESVPSAVERDEPDVIRSAERLERSVLVAAVLERNPSIEAARQAWRAAVERPAQAAALDDPMVSYGLAPLSIGSAAVRFGQELEVAQPLPYRGKRRLRGSIAAAEAEGLLAGLGELRLELARRAAILHADYVLVHEALRINAEH